MIVNESLGFGLLVGQKKQFQVITSGNCDERVPLCFFAAELVLPDPENVRSVQTRLV